MLTPEQDSSESDWKSASDIRPGEGVPVASRGAITQMSKKLNGNGRRGKISAEMEERGPHSVCFYPF